MITEQKQGLFAIILNLLNKIKTNRTLVDHIFAVKKANPLADTTAEENEIDRLVYRLYGLTEDEIAIVEGTNK